jgi:DHA1 family inner membrane transport protein
MTPSPTPPAAALDSAAPDERALLRALWALGLGGFAIGTGEFVIMGLLPEVAADVGITIPQAGHVISFYALGVVVGAPLLAVLAAHWHRQFLLMALMGLFALGNFASALAPNYLLLNILRFTTGLPHGTYFGVASLVAATLAPNGQRARAVGLMMLGLSTATLVGVPGAAWLGQVLGWRAAFVLVGVIALAAVVLIRRNVPLMPAPAGTSPLSELSALGNKQVWLTLAIGAIGSGGLFAVFSYVKPTLMNAAGMPLAGIPVVLAMFGAGMITGMLVGPKLADRSIPRAMFYVLLWSIFVLTLFSFTASNMVLGAINVFLIGTTVAIGPALQIRLMDVAGKAQTLAAALNHSAFNVANALGAWLGGVAISAGLGWTSTGWVGALLGVAGLGVFGLSIRDERQRRRALTA